MRVSSESVLGRTTLMFGHVAGMLDLVIMPLWVGGLMATHRLQPQEAGGIVTLFLVGVLVSNVIVARQFGRLPSRAVIVVGYGLGALAFLTMARSPLGWFGSLHAELSVLHFVAGLGAGAGLSCVHGTIARTGNPHRTFAIVNFGMGLFAIAFFGGSGPLMPQLGVAFVFYGVFGLLATAVVLTALAFPTPAQSGDPDHAADGAASRPVRLNAAMVLGFFGVILMQIGLASSNSFVERVGDFRGFSHDAISGLFAINGFIALLPPILAGLLERRLPALGVAVGALVVNGLASVALFNTTDFAVYSVAFVVLIFTAIFGHTFIFGLFSRFDPSGRMNASTPFMLMSGVAIAPFLAGTVVQFGSYSLAGLVACGFSFCGAACFAVISRQLRSGVGAPSHSARLAT